MMDKNNQVIDYLQSYNLGIGFQDLKDRVIAKENCILCGMCTALCPRIEMNEKKPMLIDYDPECSTCFRYCPQTFFPEDVIKEELFQNGSIIKSHPLGFYQKLLTAKSTNDNILKVAQNGGVVCSLLINSVDKGIIYGVILTG